MLPQVRLADGQFARSTEERLLRWHEHFADMESGTTISPADYPLHFARQGLGVECDTTVLELDALPTLAAMELVVLQLKTGTRQKDSGGYGVPGFSGDTSCLCGWKNPTLASQAEVGTFLGGHCSRHSGRGLARHQHGGFTSLCA